MNLIMNKKIKWEVLSKPSGTGKTLCLLCSLLSLVQTKNKIKNIYYCAKTVSQIYNVLNGLHKTCYILKNVFLAPRKFACLNYKDDENYN